MTVETRKTQKTENKKKIKIYLASGFFNEGQIKIVDFIEAACMVRPNLDLFSPRKSSLVPPGSITDKKFRQATFASNVDNIANADMLIASTLDKDMGTVFECGYAYANNIPIFYIHLTENVKGFNLMLSESGRGVITTEQGILDLLDIINSEGIYSDKLSKFEYGGKVE